METTPITHQHEPGEPAAEPPRRRTTLALAVVSTVAVLALATVGFLLLRSGAAPESAAPGDDPPAEEARTATADDGGGAGGGAVSSLDDVREATVQIVAEGSFVDPDFGELEAAGAGSGFIVDPDGIAVTNNHVVAGAGLLRVYVGGDDEPRNARVLGVSECSDLAVIDLEGEGYPHLSFYDGEVKPGLDVYAAGFPLGDPEYTLTRGIVAKAAADGETEWASVDHVVEHDATINPGNSGGPLITADGQVLGVNYAKSEEGQFFAIASSGARSIVDELKSAENVDSIGVNGQAIADESSGAVGVWVAGVQSGSPADKAGIQGGDIIEKIEGVSLATDGTMADYCDVLRSRTATDPMNVQVLRFSTAEVLTGQLNGDPLETAFSFADEFGEENDVDGAGSYGEYVTVADDTGRIEVDLPAEWSDIDGASTDIEGVDSPSIMAAPDLDDFLSTWNTPGMEFLATSALEPGYEEELLDEFDLAGECTSAGREDYDDGLYTGRYELWESCGGIDTSYFVVAASPDGGNFSLLVAVQVTSDADLEALDRIIESFIVTGEL